MTGKNPLSSFWRVPLGFFSRTIPLLDFGLWTKLIGKDQGYGYDLQILGEIFSATSIYGTLCVLFYHWYLRVVFEQLCECFSECGEAGLGSSLTILLSLRFIFFLLFLYFLLHWVSCSGQYYLWHIRSDQFHERYVRIFGLAELYVHKSFLAKFELFVWVFVCVPQVEDDLKLESG